MISFICAIPQEPDDKAFMLSLYDSYYKLMYSIAYKYVSDILTVDDIVQDSIVSLYGKIDILKPMPDKVLAGYIVSTVRNTAINRLRVKEYVSSRSGYSVDLKMKLQRDGRTIKTWTDSGSKGFDILKTYYVTPGHDYQVVVTATVYNSSGKIVETPSAYSNEVSY